MWGRDQALGKTCIYIMPRKLMDVMPSKRVVIIQKNILELWKRNTGICILQLPVETNHFEAHCKEYALIKAINLRHLNNQINGTAYGCMKMWNDTEVRNFGNMLLYYAMNICINERPAIIKH